jgi:antitoxin CcdA
MGKVELRLEIDEALADQARAEEIQLSLFLERALRQALGPKAAEERAKLWAAENADAIAAHNRYIEEYGVFGEEWRRW